MNKVETFIENGWSKCLKHNTKDEGTLIGLPYPYIVPTVGYFNEIYYWDTYFTNVGLIQSGHFDYAKNNLDDMLYLVEKYGFMPNGNRTYYLNRSQPPFLSEMVKDIYVAGADDEWLSKAYKTLKKEYSFWMKERISPMGLNVYGGELSSLDGADDFIRRTGHDPGIEHEKLAQHNIITCESGWDVNPRWGTEGYNYAPVDLNSLMFLMESNMQKFASRLGIIEESQDWENRAVTRKDLMMRYMRSEDGIMLDYNFEKDELSHVFSAASYYPMFAGMTDEKHAEILVKNIHRLEENYGISTCEKNDVLGSYQWDYPNGWACLQYIVVMGLIKYGYSDDAKRIAGKYIELVDKIFEETGNLWEKYNVTDGSINVTNEYDMPAMLGWTAGVYLAFKKLV